MGQSSPINSEWKTGCIGQSTGTEEQVRKVHARIDKTGTFQSDSIFSAIGLQYQALTEKLHIYYSNQFHSCIWMDKVGRTSKRDVKQKEKKG